MKTIEQDAANDDISVIHIQVEDNTFDSTDEVINVTSSSDIERNRANCTPVDDNTSEYFPLSRYNSSSSIHEKVSEPQTGYGNLKKNSAVNGDFNVDQRELILEEQSQQVQDDPGSNLDFNSKNWSNFHTLVNVAVSDYTKEEPVLGKSSEGASRPDSQPSFLPFPLAYYDPYSYWKNYFRDLNSTKDEGDHPGTSILNNNHTWSEKVGNILAHTHHIQTLKSEDAATNFQVPSYHDFPCQNRLGLSGTNDSLSNVESYQGYTLTAMPKQPYYRVPFYNYQSSSRFDHGKPVAAASDFPFFFDYNQSSSFSNTINERLLSNQAQSNPSCQMYLQMPYKGESSLAEKACTDTASEAGPSGNYFTEYTNPETSSRTFSPTPAPTLERYSHDCQYIFDWPTKHACPDAKKLRDVPTNCVLEDELYDRQLDLLALKSLPEFKDYPCLLIMEVHTSIVCANEESDKGHVFEEVETDESGSSKSKLKMETIGQDAANDDISVIHVQVEDNTFDSTDEVINVTSSSDIERNRANCTPVDDNTSEYFPLSRYNSSSSIHEKVSEPQTGSGNVDNLVLWLKHVETNE
ncbi:hypothetical protein QYM36_009829 [Artemia franciscana]|uniref:Uncharacterized protein n=1 Tax=Artemia franciscana TaxID=6661 RepID=A0AA88I3Z7_ARTSF|nr:hypothetical protein QYM36_009829 [Artemia franciscana]